MNPAPDAYTLALQQERQAWNALVDLQRTHPEYAEALSRWRAAADSIDVALRVKTTPPSTPLGSGNSDTSARAPSRVRRP
jgi:ferric-dicitrate binding protein FerR (iron transport regulator)